MAIIAIVGSLAIPGCMVGEDPTNGDAKAGDGLSDLDKSGTVESGIRSLNARVCAEGATTLGVDVSYYQGNVDWARAKAAGVGFAFIRVSDGAVFHDPKFARNWSGAKTAGVIRGAYQFFRPAQDVAEQADMMIAAIGTYTPGDLPPVLDVEATGGLAGKSVATRVKTWVDRVTAALGVTPIVYTGKYFWRDQVGGATTFDKSPLWIAQYTSKCPDLPSPWTRWTFWQNNDRGSIDGISGAVDLDKFNGSLDDLRAFAGGAAPAPAAAPLPFYWYVNADGSRTFISAPGPEVESVEIRVDDYLIGASTPSAGEADITYVFDVEADGRTIETRGLDHAGAVVAVGNGLVDSTPTPAVYVDQTGASEYEIGLETPGADVTSIEVYADDFPLTDSVSGLTRSKRGAVRHQFSDTGDRELRIVSHAASGATLASQARTLHVR